MESEKIIEVNYEVIQVKSDMTFKSTSDKKINSISFVNKSTDNFPNVKGYPMAAGEVISFDCNNMEEDKTSYLVSIDQTVGTPNCWAIIKYNEYK